MVRPSTTFYRCFSLSMDRSLGFGSTPADCNGHLSLAFTLPPPIGLSLPTTVTRWIVLQKARRHPEGLRLLVRTQFQALFHSPVRGSFHLSLTVLVRYRSQNIFSLGRWSSQVQTGFLVSRPTQDLNDKGVLVSPTGLSPSLVRLSSRFGYQNTLINFMTAMTVTVFQIRTKEPQLGFCRS